MDLNELAAKFGGKPVEAEEPKKTEVNELAAKFGGKPVEEKPAVNDLAAQFGGVPVDTKAPKPDELGRYDAAKQETKLDPEEEAKLKEEYGISSEMGNIDYASRLLKRAGKQAAVGVEQSFGGLKRFGNDILGLDNTDNQKNLDHLDAVTKTLGSPESHAAKIVEGAVSSIIQQVPLIIGGIGAAAAAPVIGGAALATAGAAEAIAGGTALTGMFVQSFGQTYDESRREGLDLKDSTIRSGLYGTLEVVGEKFGLGAEIKALKASAKGVPTKELAGYFAKALAREVPGEELTYAGQFAVDKGYGMNPEAGLQEFFEGAADTLAATVVQGGIMMGAGASVNKGVQSLKGHLDEKQQRAEVRDIYKQDLEAKGEKPTKDQLDTIVDNHFKVMAEEPAAAEENKGEEYADIGTDTGTAEPGLQVSEQEGSNEPATGTATSTTGSLGGDQRAAGVTTAGEETERGALDPEVKARATNYLASIDDKTLIPTARTVNSIARDLGLEVKKGAKMANTIEAIKTAIAPVEAQQTTREAQTPEEVAMLQQHVDTLDFKKNLEQQITSAQTTPANQEQNDRETYQTSTGPWTYFKPGAIVNQNQYPGQKARVTKVLDEGPGSEFTNMYEIEIDVEGHPEGFDENGNPVKTVKSIASDRELNNLNPPEIKSELPTILNAPAQDSRLSDIAAAMPEHLQTLLNTAVGHETERLEKSDERAYDRSEQLYVAQNPIWQENQSRNVKSGKARAAFINAFNKQYPELANNDRRQGEITAESVYNHVLRQQKQKAQVTSSPKENELSADDPLRKPLHPEVEQAIKDNNLKGVLNFYKTKGNKFLAAFAKRLSELGLTTNIYSNKQNELVKAYLDTVKGQRERFLLYIEANYPDAYKKYFEPVQIKFDTYNPEAIRMLAYYFNFIRAGGAVAEKGKLVKVDLNPIAQDLADLAKRYSDVNKTLTRAAGSYFDIQDAININPNLGGNTNHTVIHEISHAATHWAIDHPELLDEKQRRAVGNLQILYQNAKAKINKGQYGFTNIHEFIAEAFSNPEFQKELRKLKTTMRSDQSMWSKFIQLVGQIFGTDNVLFHTMANADVIFSANKGSTSTPTNSTIFSNETSDELPKITKGGVHEENFVLNPGENSGYWSRLIKGRLNWKDVNKANVKSFFTNVNDHYRQYLLGALTLDQLTDLAGEELPQFKLYVHEIDAMIATRNRIMAEGDKPIRAWAELLKSNPEKSQQLAHMMLQATINKIDPDPTSRGYNAKDLPNFPKTQEAWNKLVSGKDGAIAMKIYRDVRAFYERRMDEYLEIQEKRLVEREQAKNTDPKEIKRLALEQRKAIQEGIISPYFPLKRFGEYWLQFGKGKDKIFMQFESAAARNAGIEQVKADKRKQGYKDEDINTLLRTGEGFTELAKSSLSDIAQLNRLKERIDMATEDVAADPTAVGNELNSLREAMKDSMDQYVLEIAPNQSIRKMFLHRDNIQGASEDMLRAFAESRYRIAYQRARFEHMPQLFNAVEAARIRLRDMPYGKEAALNRALVRELELNLKTAVLEPPKQSAIVRGITQFGFLHFLTSPASAVVNMMAIPGIYIPFARAKYGTKPVLAALAKYNKLLGGTGFVNDKTGKYEFLSLARSKMSEMPLLDKNGKKILIDKVDETTGQTNKVAMTYADAYEKGVLLGAIDTTLSHESAHVGDTPSADYTGRFQKFMYYASLPFHAAEKYNRETTYMATFELAYAKHIQTLSPAKAFEKATQDARDLVQKTMFNYNTANKPRYFRGNLVSIVSQFKMYPQQMTVLMARTFYNSLGGGMKTELEAYAKQVEKDPRKAELMKAKEAELKDIKKEAIESFWGMMGMTMITAGLSGMPFYFLFSAIASAFHAAFGDSDEPFDADNWFKNWCNRHFGGFVGDSISRGVLSQATGANFADRMSINMSDMWFPSVKKSQDEVQYLQNVMTNLMGPVAGAALGYAEALKRLNDGHYERAAEAMLPAGIKNIFVGTRYLVEGKALTMKGDTLDDNVPARDALKQMLGFSPEDTAQKQKAAMEMKSQDMEITQRKTDLENAFFMAFDSGDSDMQQRVMQKIIKFDTANPEYMIDAKGLQASIKRRYMQRALANMTGGVNINKKAIGKLAPMLGYSEE